MANPDSTINCGKDVRDSTLVRNSLSSCLRDSNKSPKRQLTNRSVSFPENDNQIVTGYLEPVNPWEYAESTNKETVLVNYLRSSEKHGTNPIQTVVDQLECFDYDEIGSERFDCLNLKSEQLILGSCEALEEVLKRLQFHKINLEDTGLDDEAAVALFDMIEYYEAATQLNISNNNSIGVRGWQAASRMLKRTKCLEELECRGTVLTEQVVPILGRALRLGTQLQVLKLEACSLSGRSLVVLVAGLKLNTTLKELYLGENYLGSSDGLQLAGLLKCNTTLQLLDLSNNGLEDSGVAHICDSLCEQSKPAGLGILVLWNNKLGPASAYHVAKALRGNDTLEVLNIGQNDIGDQFLRDIQDSLIENRNLLRLGIQSTNISGEGALTLAHVLTKNSTLQRIDVRDNNIEVSGVAAFAEALKQNTSVTQIDLDDQPRGRISDTLEKYSETVDEVRSACCRNEAGGDEALLRARLSVMAARKISLTCDTLRPISKSPSPQPPSPSYPQQSFLQVGGETKRGGRLRSPAPSPIPSPVASPSPTRTRFQVSRVNEDSPPETPPVFSFNPSRSRFKVTVVEPSGEQQHSPFIPQPIHSQQQQQNPSTPPRTRKLASWVPMVSPGLEIKAASGLEKLLGLFQNPFTRGAQSGNTVDSSSDGGGATWPASRAAPPPVETSTHSASLSHLTVIPPTGNTSISTHIF
ncbi:unnamed protein product [Nezara viridula]|uniref:Protein phosphatase 1 regulatory subunit 37 n=1 Tax=Nezara viridula TaxID=85310 RepID=A0A9P0MTG9_NEZVI|nr:unnamed protein product [Nezara viridula]